MALLSLGLGSQFSSQGPLSASAKRAETFGGCMAAPRRSFEPDMGLCMNLSISLEMRIAPLEEATKGLGKGEGDKVILDRNRITRAQMYLAEGVLGDNIAFFTKAVDLFREVGVAGLDGYKPSEQARLLYLYALAQLSLFAPYGVSNIPKRLEANPPGLHHTAVQFGQLLAQQEA